MNSLCGIFIPFIIDILIQNVFGQMWIQSKGCSVHIDELPQKQPLYLKLGGNTIWPVNNSEYMEFSARQRIELFCPSTYDKPSGKSGSQVATCVSKKTFTIDNTYYNLTDIVCSDWPVYSARKTGENCNGGVIYESGFAVGPSRFVKQLEICFNEALKMTRYVKHSLDPAIKHLQGNVVRTNFGSTFEAYRKTNVEDLYSQDTQFNTINKSLNGFASNWIDKDQQLYLAKGHMAAKADFIYSSQQRGTFLLLNAAPQWQVFNLGNWKTMEANVRNWIVKANLNVDCYTGVYGVTTLRNRSRVHVPLYLDYDANNNGLIPVPMLYFRVIIEKQSKRGLVLIGVNNPHLTIDEIKRDYILCQDVSAQITWLTWKKTDIKAGYSYACSVSDFATKNPNLPKFDVTSLLK